MATPDYPSRIQRMLVEAELLADAYMGQPDATALCFDILAEIPDHDAATRLIYRAFCNPDLIRENRKALQRLIDEWDDRPWQQRRRLALSFHYMSRWPGQHREYGGVKVKPNDVAEMLEEGKGQLLQDYLLGQTKGSEVAWPIFQAAIGRTSDPALAMLWVAELYADQGFFAESVEVLEDLLAQFPNDSLARRLWAEVRWWRDNQQRIPWIPPARRENGRLYRRMMADIDPNLADADPLHDHMPPDPTHLPADFALPDSLPETLVEEITAVLNTLPPTEAPPTDGPVNWHYLDLLESGDIDTSQFPAWAQYMLLDIDNPRQEMFLKRYLLEYLSNKQRDEEE
ncbi:MAG: tetratricopeptide repeat protein [Anaerolineales bacterium]|nr:tetratricopeptide repeat protein [Anaerolineales bacterium]